MPLPRFDFAPHEWPPSAYGEHEGVANVVFSTNWNGEDAEVMARWVKLSGSVILFFRVPEKTQDTWLVASHAYTPAQFGFMVGHTTPSHIAASAQAQAEHAIKMSFFGRARNFDASSFGFLEKEWLYLSVDGQKGCWNGAGSSLNSAIFKLKAEPPSFSQEIADPSSDVRFALRWSHLSPDERLLEAIRFGQSDLNELRSVVRAVGIAEATRRNLPKDWTVVFADALRFGENSLRTLDSKNKNARLRRWSHHLNRYFNPHKDEELAASYLCVRHFAIAHYASFVEGPPSQHERLEAALFLREWATGKIPSDELRLLLPKL